MHSHSAKHPCCDMRGGGHQTSNPSQKASVASGEAAMVLKKRTLIAIDSNICESLRALLGTGFASKNAFTCIAAAVPVCGYAEQAFWSIQVKHTHGEE